MGHPPDHIPDLDPPRSRSPFKKDKKEKVSKLNVNIYEGIKTFKLTPH